VEEADSRGYNVVTWVLNVVPVSGWNDSLALCHANLSSLSCAVGHARIRIWRDKTTLKEAKLNPWANTVIAGQAASTAGSKSAHPSNPRGCVSSEVPRVVAGFTALVLTGELRVVFRFKAF